MSEFDDFLGEDPKEEIRKYLMIKRKDLLI